MPQYALIGTHPPDNCPIANKAVKEFVQKTMPELPKLAQGLGIKFLTQVILQPSHKILMIVEAPNAEAVYEMSLKGGLQHFNDMELYGVQTIEEGMKELDQLPPTVY